tara:strand:- start:4552 stop:5304 length:753 start_codon:yes stop_codon:yes gene_type:complete
MSIISVENKELLNQLLDNHPLKKRDHVRFTDLFDSHLERINKTRFTHNNNLTTMNKEFLREFQSIANKMDTGSNNIIRLNPNPSHANTQADNQNITRPRIEIFEERLKEHQHDFNNANKVKKPTEIDFSDKNQNEAYANTNTDSTMKRREDELNKIMNDVTYKGSKGSAEKWIKNGVSGKNQKHVTFKNDTTIENGVITNDINLSLYNKLKPKKTENEITNTLLKTLIDIQKNMLKKQNDIVEQLKLMHN